MTPLHVHGARTQDEYRSMQRRAIKNAIAMRPTLEWQEPWLADRGRFAWVSGGSWVVSCDCGNAPSADPDWMLALCFECGAVYEQVAFPGNRAEIEAKLLARNPSARHWDVGEIL